MNKPFDMEIFLAGVLTGAHATRKRHIRQAKAIQAAISERWNRDNPLTWQKKHILWFLNVEPSGQTQWTRYYYTRTAQLITERLKKTGSPPPLPNKEKAIVYWHHMLATSFY